MSIEYDPPQGVDLVTPIAPLTEQFHKYALVVDNLFEGTIPDSLRVEDEEYVRMSRELGLNALYGILGFLGRPNRSYKKIVPFDLGEWELIAAVADKYYDSPAAPAVVRDLRPNPLNHADTLRRFSRQERLTFKVLLDGFHHMNDLPTS